MYASSLKLLKTIVETDSSLNQSERELLTVIIEGGKIPAENVPSQIISRKEVRDRYFQGDP